MKEEIIASNVKCGGCASTIKDALLKIQGIQQVEVDVASGRVEIEGEALDRGRIGARLAELGYPEAS